jgi:hypothetical protein
MDRNDDFEKPAARETEVCTSNIFVSFPNLVSFLSSYYGRRMMRYLNHGLLDPTKIARSQPLPLL